MLLVFLKEGLLKCALLNIFNKLKCFTTCILYFLVFLIIYNKYFVFVLMLIFTYKHDIIACFFFVKSFKRYNEWS
jgi:hypothetical protein